jgi:ABC-type sugar transport system permease subunit
VGLGRDGLWILLFLLPFLVLYIGFTLWPLLATIAYSLFDWDGIHPLNQFVGLGNYAQIVTDPLFWISFRNTLLFAAGNTVIKLPLTLLAAVLLTRRWLWFKRWASPTCRTSRSACSTSRALTRWTGPASPQRW